MGKNNVISEPGLTNQLKKGTKIEGNLSSESDARIDGTIEGNVSVKGKVIIGESGIIVGDITCSICEISGTVKGKLNIENRLTLKASADFSGDMTTAKLIIEPGAKFNGTCKMDMQQNAEILSAKKK